MSNPRTTTLILFIVLLVLLALAGVILLQKPSVPAPSVPGNASSTPAVSTSTPAAPRTGSTGTNRSVSGAARAYAPQITSFIPAAGTPGTTVLIRGTGFSKTRNYLLFGTTANRHHLDGSPDNQIAVLPSPDGKTLTFTVPENGPSGLLCDSLNHCVAISAVLLSPGTYPVSVRVGNTTSSADLFVLLK